MDETVSINPAAEDAAQLQLAIAQCLEEITELHRQMSHDQMEIDRSQMRTRAILDELTATLGAAGRKAA